MFVSQSVDGVIYVARIPQWGPFLWSAIEVASDQNDPTTGLRSARYEDTASPRRVPYFSSLMRAPRRASNIQCSATFSYALFTNGSLACAARCLASSAFRRQVSISDDIPGGSSNAPKQAAI